MKNTAPAGMNLRHTLRGHHRSIRRIVWSPDGRRMASAAEGETIRIWDAHSGNLVGRSTRSFGGALALAWSPNGRWIASGDMGSKIRIWDSESGRLLRTLEEHRNAVNNLAWSPDGEVLASGSYDRKICLIRARDWKPLRTVWAHKRPVSSVAWAPDGRLFATGSVNDDTAIKIWELASGKLLRELDCATHHHAGLAWSPDGRTIAVGGDGPVEIWDARLWRKSAIVEGHTDVVTALAFSPDGRVLVTKGLDHTVRLWRTDRWSEVARVHELQEEDWVSAVAFHPAEPVLATLGDDDSVIRIWDLDLETVLGETAAADIVQYTSAKVVLVGESNAGKSCLAMRLAEDRYPEDRELGTTHGMRFWRVAPGRFGKASHPPEGERRDVVLWDMGGQDEYRLVHQLFLHDSTLALIFFDPTRGRSSFEEVEAWNKRLLKQLGQRRAARLLVGSKVDRPNSMVDRQAVEQLCESCGFAGYYETSALTGRGVKKLRKAVGRALDWDSLAKTSRPELFQSVRDEIHRRREEGQVVLAQSQLESALHQADPEHFDPVAVGAVCEQLAAQGFIVDTRQGPGERNLVLKIEEVERYAGSLILAARKDPRGVPALEERLLASPSLRLPGIKKRTRLPRPQERVVLECVAQLLVEGGICMQHEGLLVFPSLFRSTAGPEQQSVLYSVSLYYDFSGAIDNIYASLVAWLVLGKAFGRVSLWGDRAEFRAARRGTCGVRKVDRGRGFARLDVYFEERTSRRIRDVFRGFVEEHLRHHGLDIAEHVEVKCSRCGYLFAEDDIRERISHGADDIGCVKCDVRVDLAQAVMRTNEGLDPELQRRKVALLTRVVERSRERAVRQVSRAFAPADEDLQATAPLRVLQLSDLHFGADANTKNALQPLVADIRDPAGGLGFDHLDYLVVAGDLSKSGAPEEFEKARTFLSALIRTFKLSAQRCVIVPGNHDLSWDAEVYSWRARRKVSKKELAQGRCVQQGDGYLVRDEQRYGERFANFDRYLYHPLIQLPYPMAFEEQALAHLYADTGLQFLALNTAWEVDEWHRGRASIHAGALTRGLENMEAQVAAHPKKRAPLLRVGVWHHPVTGNDKIIQDAFMARLRQAGVRLVLHGHVHEDRADLFGHLHPRKIHVVGAGSFGASPAGRPESTPQLYNLLEIARDHTSARVYTRRMARQGGAWEPWPAWEGDTPNHKRAYYDIYF